MEIPSEPFDQTGISDGDEYVVEIRRAELWDRYEPRRVEEGKLVDFSESFGLSTVTEPEDLARRRSKFVETRWRECFPRRLLGNTR